MSDDYQNKVIQELIEHELALKELYEVYAEKFPENKDFWNKIAAEELGHATWIRRLESDISQGKTLFKEDRFNTQLIQTSTDYVNSQIASALQHDLELINALSVAVDIEQVMLENKFFEVFEVDSIELKQIMQSLQKATEEHLQRVRKHWEEERHKKNIG